MFIARRVAKMVYYNTIHKGEDAIWERLERRDNMMRSRRGESDFSPEAGPYLLHCLRVRAKVWVRRPDQRNFARILSGPMYFRFRSWLSSTTGFSSPVTAITYLIWNMFVPVWSPSASFTPGRIGFSWGLL